MIHLTDQQLSASIDRELNEASESNVRDHLSNCADCATRLERFEDLEERLIRALWSEPGDAVFEGIARELDERTRPGAGVSASRRVAAHAASVVPVPQAASARGIETRVRAAHRSSPFPWGLVILVVAAAAGIGAFTVGLANAPRWLSGSGAQDRAIPAAATAVSAASEAAPAVTSVANDEPQPEPEPVESAVPGGTPAVEPEQLETAPPKLPPPPPRQRELAERERAQSEVVQPEPSRALSAPIRAAKGDSPVVVDFGAPQAVNAAGLQGAAAGAYSTAEEYEAAANGWEQSLGMLQGGEYREGRLRLAEARYRAWQLEPTSARAARAAATIRAYMVVAPQGPDRENASRWLREIEEGGTGSAR